ncbi:hypothetical protein pEaSNUABM38_00148 [Erwinia phage pEa_SNUABM_38]|nr:hypothetical protein pEaSNUABM38_00148 [Erwinia phage pEa_SNUABM_38]
MALKLKWKNNNVVANTVKIYRGDAKLDPANLPAPLVTLTNGETSWVDDTAVYGKKYFYILAVVTENDVIPTANQEILVADNRGVGPSTLLYGDDNLGYFGQVLPSDFVTNLDVVAAAVPGQNLPSTLIQTPWYKFVRKGRVIYVPSASFGQVTYNQLYAAGLVYGVNSNGPAEANLGGLTPVNQYRPIEFKSQKYIPRLMRGWSDKPQNSFDGWDFATEFLPDSTAYAKVNEFNDFMFGVVNFVPEVQRSETFVEGNMDAFVGAAGRSYGASNEHIIGRILCQERNTANVNVLARMRRNFGYGSGGAAHDKSFLQAGNAQSPVQGTQWVPVLELEMQTVTL